MQMKEATPEDAKAISKIYALSWKSAYKGIVPEQYLNELKSDFWESKFKNWISNNILTAQLIFDDNLLVGCIAYGKARDNKLLNCGEIMSFYLLPEYFGKGYGQKLFQATLVDLKQAGYKNIYLWVLKENLRARKFYEKNGFHCNNDEFKFDIMGKQLVDLRYIFSFK